MYNAFALQESKCAGINTEDLPILLWMGDNFPWPFPSVFCSADDSSWITFSTQGANGWGVELLVWRRVWNKLRISFNFPDPDLDPNLWQEGCYGPCFPMQATPGYQRWLSLHMLHPHPVESTDSRSLSLVSGWTICFHNASLCGSAGRKARVYITIIPWDRVEYEVIK